MIINNSKVKQRLKENEKVKNKYKNVLMAFLFGGLIGMFSEAVYQLFNIGFKIDPSNSSLFASAIIIFISFYKFANIAHAGALIPISGFANSITSSALEGKSEGLIFGIGGKIFSLIGSVCTYGIVSSIILGLFYYLIKVI